MAPLTLWIGWRYLKAKRRQGYISIITWISVGGVAVGVMAMIVVLAVMSGFEEDLRDKILGTNSHIMILARDNGGMKDYTTVIQRAMKMEHVVSASPFIYNQVMLTTPAGVSGVVIRGIDAASVGKVTELDKNLTHGSIKDLDYQEEEEPPADGAKGEGGGEEDYLDLDKISPRREVQGGIILGKELALSLSAFMDSTVTVVSPSGEITPAGMIPLFQTYRVVGFFETGMYEYDAGLAYISLKNAQKLFNMGDSVTGVEVKVDDIYISDRVAEEIREELGFPYWTRDWKEMNRTLFSALKLEQVTMFIILALIVLVAAFNIISSLVMLVMEKGKDIAILKSMGATKRGIMEIFTTEGLIIGIAGTIIGVAGGFIACLLLDRYQFIKLPSDIYYLDTLPVKLESGDVLMVVLASIMLSFLATIYPALSAARLNPVEGIRYE